MIPLQIGDTGKYLSIGVFLPCEIIEIKTPTSRNGGLDLKIKILKNSHYRCRNITNIKSSKFIKDI